MYKLENFKQLKSPLLKEWSEKDFEKITNHINYILLVNFKHNIIIERGADAVSVDYLSEYQLENVFGLPYTSSSNFAAVWNTNTQTVAKYGARIYFRGVAINEQKQTIIIFEDENEHQFYFCDYDFYNYQEEERRRQAAREWGGFVKVCNKIKNTTLEILKKYNGKKYGEKTAQKIREEIRANFEGFFIWLDATHYGQGLSIEKENDHKKKFKFYFDFLNESNEITTPSENGRAVADIEELDTGAAFEQAEELIPNIQKNAAELLQDLKKFQELTRSANQYSKTILGALLKIDDLSRGLFDWEA